jgi:CHAT domain-containing protein
LFDALAHAKVSAGKAQRKSGQVAEAIASFREAIVALERVPIGPGVETFFDDRRSPYLALVDLLATEKGAPASALADAFLAWERARTRSLANLLGGDGAVVVKDMTPAERDEERSLTRATRTLTVRLRRERGRSKPDPDRIAAVGKELEQAVSDRAVFRRKLFEAHPSLPVLRAQSEPAGLETASRVLAPSEALLSFAVMEQRTHVFYVADHGAGATPERAAGFRTIEIKAADLGAKVAAFRDAVARRDPRAAESGRELYDLLLAPVRDSIRRAKSVVVLPDVFLWALPFEALQDGRGRALVQDFAVSYAPSLTALAAMRAAPRQEDDRRLGLLAAADPAISAVALERLSRLRPAGSAPFVGAAREVRSLVPLFGPQASQVLTREQVRADRVSAARQRAALHLAVPGCLLETSPLFSLLAFSAAGRDDGDQGLLEIGDAMGWTLPASVVTLSRTEAGPGGINGEALTALAWALHVAGAGTIVVNRWLPQETDSRAVTGFYRAWLARGTAASPRPTPAAAMQKSARALIAAPGAQVADWAGFMVIGR